MRDVHLFWDGGSIYLLSLLTCNFSNTAADILLWRDEKRTFSFVTVLFVLFYWFLLSDRTFVSSAAKFLLVISLALFIHGVLPSQVYVFWLFSYLLSRLIWCGCFLLHSQEFCSVLWLSTEFELLLQLWFYNWEGYLWSFWIITLSIEEFTYVPGLCMEWEHS